jgi:hypothetical protein
MQLQAILAPPGGGGGQLQLLPVCLQATDHGPFWVPRKSGPQHFLCNPTPL